MGIVTTGEKEKKSFTVIIWNLSNKSLSIGVSGNERMDTVRHKGATSFRINGTRFTVVAHNMDDTPYKDKIFTINKQAPSIPYKGKLYDYRVIIR